MVISTVYQCPFPMEFKVNGVTKGSIFYFQIPYIALSVYTFRPVDAQAQPLRSAD